MDVDVIAETVKKVAKRMHGSAGPGGIDAVAWQDWTLRFGGASRELREAIAEMARWLANTFPRGQHTGRQWQAD